MRSAMTWVIGLAALLLQGCGQHPQDEAAPRPVGAPAATAQAPVRASALEGQRGSGQPYEIVGTEVWDVPDPASGRTYQVFIGLPPSYAEQPARRYPVLYVTDADYAFPLIRQIGRRLNVEGPKIEEFILVGLSYARGDDGMTSRRRDYTPSPAGAGGDSSAAVHGGAADYMAYLEGQVLPFVAQRYRTDEERRLFLGHSYGSLLGTQILLTQPRMFSGYILGSPSYWYDTHWMEGLESRFAEARQDLHAEVYMYIGEQEQRAFGQRYDMVADARRMVHALSTRRYPSLQMTLDVLDGETHLTVAPRGFTRGLQQLLPVPAASARPSPGMRQDVPLPG